MGITIFKNVGDWFDVWLLVPNSCQNSGECTKLPEKSSDFLPENTVVDSGRKHAG